VANLPSGCKFKKSGGLFYGLTNSELERVFEGSLAKWSELEYVEGTCNAAITRVVRKDASGTTYQFKHYLGRVDDECLPSPRGESFEDANWYAEMRIGSDGKPNTYWPQNCPEATLGSLVSPSGDGGAELVAKVKATAGSIGYAALPDAKAGGATIINLQNSE